MLDFFESIRIKDVFEVFQDFYLDVYHSSNKGISDYLQNVKVINFLDYYRENLPKEYKYSGRAEDSEMYDFSRRFEKLVETENLERNENYAKICSFLRKFEKTQIGLDVETLELKLVRNSTEIPTLCDPDSDTYSKLDETTQTIKLLDLINISSINNMNYASIEKKFHFNLLKYIAGIIKGKEFATDLAKEIVESVAKKIASFSISSRLSSYVDLEEFPAVFFKDEDLIKFIFRLKDFYEIIHDIYKDDQNNKKLKSFLESQSVNLCNYPSECYSQNELKKFISDDIFYNEKVWDSDGMLTALLNSNHSNSYFKNILESIFDKEMMSGVNLLFTLMFDPNIKIKNFSELNEEKKSKIIYSSLSDFKQIPDFILEQFMTREYWVKAFTETTTYLLNNIISGNDPKEFLSRSKFRGRFSDEFIVINDKLVFVDYIKNHDSSEPTSSVFLTEDEFSKFKSEVVPLLEKIKDEVLYKAPSNNLSVIKGDTKDKVDLLVKLLMDDPGITPGITTQSFIPYLQNMLGIIPNKFDLFFDGNLSEYAKEELLDFLAVDDVINFENLNILITESDCNINTTRIGYKYNSKIVNLLNKQDYDNLAILADYGSGIRCPIFFKKIKIG